MAGIGFVLRKLARKDNLFGVVQAYTHSALASTGPWIFTVVCLTIILAIGRQIITPQELLIFKIIITYNFSFSLVLTSPVFIICTRFVADKIFIHDVRQVPGLLIGTHLTIFITQLPLAYIFYFHLGDFAAIHAILGVINIMVISCIWVTCTFTTALKDYKTISFAFISGLSLALVLSVLLADLYGATGMLLGFSLGLAYILALLISRIFKEYQYAYSNPLAYVSYFKKFKYLAFGALFYNTGIWVDKWIMWLAPEGKQLSCNLYINPHYDSAMFLAFFTVAPIMGLFVFNIETSFYDEYLKFYRDIERQATLERIRHNHQRIIKNIFSNTSSLFILQASICIICIILAPQIMHILKMPARQIGIFRLGTLGATFHIFFSFSFIILSYFTSKQLICYIQLFFLISNALLTYIFMNQGVAFYGYGYFLSSLITFIISAIITTNYLKELPYHTFITTNKSIE